MQEQEERGWQAWIALPIVALVVVSHLLAPPLAFAIVIIGLAIWALPKQYETIKKKRKMKERVNYLTGVLNMLGVKPKVNEDNGLEFKYQGEAFVITIDTEKIISIYDSWWATLKTSDPDTEILKQAINEINLRHNAMIVSGYSVDEEHCVLGVHSRCRTLFVKEIPEALKYLEYLLGSFFDQQRYVRDYFHRLKGQQEHGSERKVVKGFS